MSGPPSVSVLLPARDAEATLDLALASVARSRDVALEVIFVDHGSTDGTRRIAEAHRAAGLSLEVVEVARHRSFVEALEEGRRRCRAPFVARMDADDLMHPRRLVEDVAFLERHRDVAAVASCVRPFPACAVGMGMRSYVRWQNSVVTFEDIAREIWVEQPLCHPATTFRRQSLDEVGGYRDGPFPEDYDLFLRLHLAGRRLAKRPEVHHGWRERTDRMTRTDPRFSRDALCARKMAALRETKALDARPIFIAGAGKEGGRVGRALVALGLRPALYFDVSPARIGRLRHGAQVVDAKELADRKAAAPDAFLIAAVGTSGSRAIVRGHLTAAGFHEPDDAVVVA